MFQWEMFFDLYRNFIVKSRCDMIRHTDPIIRQLQVYHRT